MYERMSGPQVLHKLNLNPHQKICVALTYKEMYIRNFKVIFNEKMTYPFKTNKNIYKYVKTKHYTTLEDNRGRQNVYVRT